MFVTSYNEAWNVLRMISDKTYSLDEGTSNKAGYKVYRSEDNYYDYVCDLGDRLELNQSNGKSINIWIIEQQFILESDILGYVRERYEMLNDWTKNYNFMTCRYAESTAELCAKASGAKDMAEYLLNRDIIVDKDSHGHIIVKEKGVQDNGY